MIALAPVSHFRRHRAAAAALRGATALLLILSLGPPVGRAGAVDASPLLWDGIPGYSYVDHPTDQLGVPGVEAGAGITPEGGVFTGSVEVVPWLGGAQLGVTARRGLPDPKVPLMATGPLPAGGTAAWWAATVASVPVAVMALSPGTSGRAGVALRWGGTAQAGARPAAYRFARPVTPARPGLYTQPGQPFFAGRCWSVRRVRGALEVVRGRSVVAVILGAVRQRGRLAGPRPRRCATTPGQFATALRLRAVDPLAPVHVVVPLQPLAHADPRLDGLIAADIRGSGVQLAASWHALRDTAATIVLPEPALQKALDAAITTMLVPRYQLRDGTWVQTVNTLQYHAFWLRDAAVITNALDLVGLDGAAEENLAFFANWQSPSGEFSSRIGQRDGLGQALWALGQHVALTGDAAFARAWAPAVDRAVRWTADAMAGNPLGILPPSDPRDNERVSGELAGDQFWAVAGLNAAATLAVAAGDASLYKRAAALRELLRGRVVALARTAAVGGVLTPALDQPGGYRWGELWAAWPFPSIDPSDPLVQSTVAAAIAAQQEGVATYANGKFLHLYLGFRAWQTALRAGDQLQPVQGLYSTLAHLTATGGGFETGLAPYGTRDARTNLAPHGWLAAELTTLIHDLLAHEEDGGLTVLGAVPSAWLTPGAATTATALPTPFGPIDLTLQATETGADLSWSLRSRPSRAPRLRWPLPASVVDAVVSGGGRLVGRDVVLGGSSGQVSVRWTRSPDPGPTLAATIAALQAEYTARGLVGPG